MMASASPSRPTCSALRSPFALLLILLGAVCLASAMSFWQTYQILRAPDLQNATSGAVVPLADKSLHRAIACAVAGLVLIGTGIRLFRDTRPPAEFAPIDWHTTPRPAQMLTVRFTRWQVVVFTLFALCEGTLIVGMFHAGHARMPPVILALVLGGLVYTVGFLLYRARRRAVRAIDGAGITRHDGRRFPWDDFCGVVTRIDYNPRMQRRYVWRAELAFTHGERAWVIPQHVRNLDEVFTYLATLPQARLLDAASSPAPATPPAAQPPPIVRVETPPPPPIPPTPAAPPLAAAPPIPPPAVNPTPPNPLDLDHLVRSLVVPGAPPEFLDPIFFVLFRLEQWHFLVRGTFPHVRPYFAEFPGCFSGQPMAVAFTDPDRLQRFARENKLETPDGDSLLLSLPTAGVLPYLQGFEGAGVHAVIFNPDLASQTFYVPYAELHQAKARVVPAG